MRDRLLASTADLREILNFAIPGVHFEKYGSRNQPWDHAVAQTVDEAWSRIDPSGLGGSLPERGEGRDRPARSQRLKPRAC